MSKHVLGIFKDGVYALRRNRDFLAQLPNDDGVLYSASSSHFYAGHKPPCLKKQAFLVSIIDDVSNYIAARRLEIEAKAEEKGSEPAEDSGCDDKINAALAFSEFLESGGYYKEVLVEKLARSKGWRCAGNGRLAKIVCRYLEKESGYDRCDFNTPWGRALAVKRWRQSLLAAIKKSKAEYEERIKPFSERWTDFNTVKYMKENPGCTTLVVPEGFEDVDTRSFYSCMSGVEEIVIHSPMDSLSGYDFLHCPDLRSVAIKGRVAHMDDISSFNVLESLTSLQIDQKLCRVLRNSLKNKEEFEFLQISGGVKSIGKGAFTGFSSCSIIQLGVVDGISAATARAIVIPEVDEVRECAFLGCNEVKAVVLGGAISVRSLAFSKCPNLSVAIIRNDIRDFNTNAFFGCEAIQCIVAPDHLIKEMREFFVMEFGYEKAEGVHFIGSSKVLEHKDAIERHLTNLREDGLEIESPNWDNWGVDPDASSENPFEDELEEDSCSNPFGGDSDEGATTDLDDTSNPFGPGRLSDISAITSLSHRPSRTSSACSEAELGNPFG